MPVTNTQINALEQKIALEVRVDGRPVRNLWGADASLGVSQVNASATVHFTSRPSFAEEKKPIEIWAGYNSRTDKIFDGELTGLVWSYAPGVVSLECQDLLGRLKLNYAGDAREYNVATPASIVQNLVEAMGISSTRTHIEGSDWETCTALPLLIEPGHPLWQYVEELDLVEGFRTYTDRAGVVCRKPITGNIGAGVVFAYSKGYNIERCRRSRTKVGIENYCLVLGINYLGLRIGGVGISEAFADNPFVSDPPRFQGPTLRSSFIEDDPRAVFVAKMRVALGNKRPERYELEVMGNPRLNPLDAIGITHDAVESGSARVAIDQIQHSIRIQGASFKTNITTLGGNIVASEVNLAPIAVIDAKVFQEHDATGASIVVLVADGTGSYDPDSEDALAFAWTGAVDAGAIDPASSSAAVYQALITGAATELTLNLTVTDSAGASGSMPLIVPLNASTLLYEPLYLAWNDGVLEATIDELAWGTFSGASGVTNTPPFACEEGAIWVDDAGEIWATIDTLKTAAVSLGSPGGAQAATAGWLHELDITRVWVVAANGRVYFGTLDWSVPSVVWETRGTIPTAPAAEIREAVGTMGSLRATAGRRYYRSEDGGFTWSEVRDFGVAAVASRMAAGFEQNMVAATNAVDPLYAETGTDTTTPGGLDEISAITVGWRDPILYAGDPNGNLYSSAADDVFTALTLHADDTGGRGVQHMIRSGGIPGVIYIAADDSLMKWIPGLAAPFVIRERPGALLDSIGYGPLRRPAVTIDFVIATHGISGTWDGLHRNKNGIWLPKITPPQAAWRWVQLVAHPSNKERWLLLGFPETDWNAHFGFFGNTMSGSIKTITGAVSPVWLTGDGGATWSQVILPTGAVAGTNCGVTAIGWQEQGGRWFVLGRSDTPVGQGGCWWTGSTATDGEGHQPSGVPYAEVYWCQSGMGGEMLVSEADSPGSGTRGRLPYIANDGTIFTPGPWGTDPVNGYGQPEGPLDTIRGTREFWQTNQATLGIAHWTDYREEDPTSATAGMDIRPNDVNGEYRYVAVGDSHVFFASEKTGGLGFYRRPHATWTPTGAADYPLGASDLVRLAATDRQSRRFFVGYARVSNVWQFVVHDGDDWDAILMPDTSLSSGTGGIYSDGPRGCPFAALGETTIPI